MLFPPSLTLAVLTNHNHGSLAYFLGIEYIEIGTDYLVGRMPVNEKTKQPMGILHGGASVAFAETLGSLAANYVIDQKKFYCIGMEINANHIRPISKGYIYGTTTPLHLGKKTHVWQIDIKDEQQRRICISRHTVAVLQRVQEN